MKQQVVQTFLVGRYQFYEGQHLQTCVGKELSDKIHQKERDARLNHAVLIPNQLLLYKDAQNLAMSLLKFQRENCFVLAVEKNCRLSEVLSRTM